MTAPAEQTTDGAQAPVSAPSIDPAATHLVAELKHTSPLVSCRCDPTGTFVFAGAQDNTVRRWRFADGEQTALAGHNSWVRGLALHPAGQTLFTGGYDGRVIWWEAAAESPVPVRVIEAHAGWVRGIAVSPDGQTLATGGNDHRVRLWSATDGAPLSEFSGHASHVYAVAFHPTGAHLVSVDLKGVVKHWDLSTGAEARQLDASVLYKYDEGFRADIGGAESIAFSPDGGWLACGGTTNVTNAFAGVGNPVVALFDWQTGERRQVHGAKEAYNGVVRGLVFHAQGFLIGASGGGAGGYLLFWKPEEPTEFFQLKLANTARDVDLHPDGVRLAVPQFDGVLRVYSMTPV